MSSNGDGKRAKSSVKHSNYRMIIDSKLINRDLKNEDLDVDET